MKKNFWKKLVAVAAVGALASVALVGCGASGSSSSSASSASSAAGSADTTIKVGASVTPHAEILNQVKDTLAQEGYQLEVVEYNDYVLPNTALEDGDLDANYFQHITYLNDFNEENGTHLTDVASIHFEPFGLYAGKSASIEELPDGATIAVPNDTTNEARALLLLEQEGLITLNPDAGLSATVVDIVDNPKNLNIQEVEAAQLARVLPDVNLAAINGNYALEAGLKVSDAIATESSESDAAKAYANVLVVKEGTENEPKIQALIDALESDTVKDFIEQNYDGAVVAVF